MEKISLSDELDEMLDRWIAEKAQAAPRLGEEQLEAIKRLLS